MYENNKEVFSPIRLGVDIGGTNIKFAVLEGKELLHTDIIKTAEKSDDIIDDIVKKYNEFNRKWNISTVGVGTPGSIINGLVSAANLSFKKFPLKQRLEERISLPVTVENDANCAALGELEFGAATDCDNLVLVTIGTGIGGGVAINRQVCCGKGKFGEIGHMIIQAEGGLPCKCGLSGCWEQYVSATALIREAEKAALENKESLIYKLYRENANSLNGEKVFEAIEQKCPVAMRVYDKYIYYMVMGLESVNKIFYPDAIILTGGITKQGDKLLKSIKANLKSDMRIEISNLQAIAGVLGAAML